MSDIAIQLTAGNLDPNPCFTSEQDRLNAYVSKTQASLPINFTTVIVSSTAPSPDDRDKVWIRIDGAGRIIGTYLFSNGQWQPAFPSNPYVMAGEIREYDPNFYTPAQSADEPWFPMDGTVTGVRNRKGMFIVGAGQRTLLAGSTDTATNFIAGTNGGRETNILAATNIPAHSHLFLGVNAFGTTVSDGSAHLPRRSSAATSDPGWVTGGNTTGNDSSGNPNLPDGFNTLPPYEPTYWMQWRPDLV